MPFSFSFNGFSGVVVLRKNWTCFINHLYKTTHAAHGAAWIWGRVHQSLQDDDKVIISCSEIIHLLLIILFSKVI